MTCKISISWAHRVFSPPLPLPRGSPPWVGVDTSGILCPVWPHPKVGQLEAGGWRQMAHYLPGLDLFLGLQSQQGPMPWIVEDPRNTSHPHVLPE